jgi:hypothetical protein
MFLPRRSSLMCSVTGDTRSSRSRSSGTSDLATAAPHRSSPLVVPIDCRWTVAADPPGIDERLGLSALLLAIDLKDRVERELKGLILFLTHWIEASE